jgi:hypothetical protein
VCLLRWRLIRNSSFTELFLLEFEPRFVACYAQTTRLEALETDDAGEGYRLQDEACPPPADVPCLPVACSLFRTTRRRRLVLVLWRC